jgi:hypothetical protein
MEDLKMRLNTKAFALTAGILWGVTVFVTTIWLLIIGSQGKSIGLFWGFIDGLICGFIFAWLYNLLVPKEAK